MKVQNLLFPRAGVCTEEKMFARFKGKAEFAECGREIHFDKGGSASFDTYFGALSVEKWKKYTTAGNFSAVLELKGDFEVSLCSKVLINDDVLETVFSIQPVSCREKTLVTLPYQVYDYKGLFYFRVKALSDRAVLSGGWYEAAVKEENLQTVNIAINICTFRREAYVMRNLDILNAQILQNPDSELYDHLQVYISDNGKTLDREALNSEKIHIVPNANVGGAGGFTRGLIEIMAHQDRFCATHALMQDDDITIEPEALFRTYTLLRCRRPEYQDLFIGGAMLRNDKQNMQVEAGASWNAGQLISNKSGLNLNKVKDCLLTETEEYREFNAWWFCCTPMSVVNDKNLPLPIFIRGDDLEYGLRNMKTLLLLNGICVWHEPFENKYSSFLSYYILRNLLYDNTLHCPHFGKGSFLKRLWRSIARELVYYRYKNVDLLIRGVEDFYKGVDFLEQTDGEALHKEIMSLGYKAQPLEELDLPFRYPDYADSLLETERPGSKRLRYLSINGYLLRANRTATASMAQCRPINFYRAKRVLQYDVTSKKAFITEKSWKETWRCLGRGIALSCRTLFCYDRCTRAFRERAGEITSEAFWKKYLGI